MTKESYMTPTGEITREVIDALLESQSKNTEQMMVIATCLRDISENQKKIADRLLNGLKDDFAKKVEEKLQNSVIAKDIEHVKWFIGIVGVIVIISVVILRGLEFQKTNNDYDKMIQKIEQIRL